MFKLLSLFALLALVSATAPIAPHLAITVGKNSEMVFALRGYDVDGGKLTATIQTVPGAGKLYQLSKVFSDYGYEPKLGSQVTPGSVITGSNNRIIYTPPANELPPYGKWASFTYTISDGTSVSRPGTVTLASSSKVLIGSDFSRSTESWSVISNGARSPGAIHERSSRGSLNYYIHSRDNEINVDSAGNDLVRWSFVAPSKFLGHQTISYGGSLEFKLASASGDFSAKNLNANTEFVVLECSTCALGTGIKLVRRLDASLSFDGKPKQFSLPLKESSGWMKDPKNTLFKWTKPTQCEMVSVLNALSSIRIQGDYTRWYESIALDSVQLTHGPARSIPMKCYV